MAEPLGQLEVPDSGVWGDSLSSGNLASPYSHARLQDEYRLIVPSIRGFGASTHPGDVQSSGSIPDVVGDLMCILQKAGVSQAVVIGHVLFLIEQCLVDRLFLSVATTGALNLPMKLHENGPMYSPQ